MQIYRIKKKLKDGKEMIRDFIFCRIVNGEVPATIVFEDELTIAFMDIGQVNPGHVLVAAKSHVQNIFALDKTLASAVFCTATRVAQAIKEAIKPEGMTLLQANEAAGWQTVYHFHFHVIPRHTNDGLEMTWPAKNPPREALDRYGAKIKDALTDENIA